MLVVREYTVEEMVDPFGIIEGKRYTFLLYVDIPEDDEMYREKGVHIRVLYGSKVIRYDIVENETDVVLDFELEEDEEKYIAEFCESHLQEGLADE